MAKFPFVTPGGSTLAYTPTPGRHSSTLPSSAHSIAGGPVTGSLPNYYQPINGHGHGPSMTPVPSVSSSGYPTPRPGSSASGFDNSFSMGSPQIGHPANLFRSFPKPHSSPKMKLRLAFLNYDYYIHTSYC